MDQIKFAACVALTLGVCVATRAQIGDPGIDSPASRLNQPPAAENATLFLNVRVFDGRNTTLSVPSSVLVKGNTIERVSTSPINVSTIENATVINGQGRVLMPGLIDAHWHAFTAATPQMVLMTADSSYLHLLAGRQADATLMRGFTTVRDMGGPVFGLKHAIDEGALIGPRIYPSGIHLANFGAWRFPVLLRSPAHGRRPAEPLRG